MARYIKSHKGALISLGSCPQHMVVSCHLRMNVYMTLGEVRVADLRSILTDFVVDFVAILDSILSSDGTKIVRKLNFTLTTPFAMSILQRFSARLQPLILVEISYEM